MRAMLAIMLLLCAAVRAMAEELPAAWLVDARLITGDESTPPREASYTLRLADDRFLLELGPIRVLGAHTADDARLTAWHTHDPTTVFVAEADDLATLIRRHLPPIWSSPLARWMSGDAEAFPLVGHDWPGPPTVSPGPEPTTTRRETGAIRIVTPDVLPSLENGEGSADELIVTSRSDGETRLRQTYRPIAPGDPEAWGIDADDRTLLSSIRALEPRPAPIQPGGLVHGMRLHDSAGVLVEQRRAFEPERTPRSERRATALLLVFERVSDSTLQTGAAESLLADITAARERLGVASSERGVRRPLLIVRPVAVFDVPEYSPTALAAFDDRWEGLATDALLESVEQDLPAVLWTHPPRASIDLFAPGATAAAALIDPAGRLIDVLRLDGRESTLADWIVRTLIPEPASADGP